MALFGCIWIQDFAAWAAEREDRALGFAPFFVHHRDKIVAVSDLAREAGILGGWTPQRALSLVHDAEAVPLDAGATAYAWREVLNALYEHTPCIEAPREGVAYFEVPSHKDGQQALCDWVRDLGARCGAAEGRTLAELSAFATLAGTVQNVPGKSAQAFLASVPVERLAAAGISENTIERLQWFGWDTVGALRGLDQRHLIEQFEDGGLVARFAGAAGKLQPRDHVPVTAYAPPAAIHARIVFDEAATEPGEWEPALPELLQRVCGELHGREAGTLTVVAATSRGRKVSTCLLREPLRDAKRLFEPALAVATAMLDDSEVHALEVELGGLSVHLHQEELFDSKEKRQSGLIETLRLLKSRGVGNIVRIRVRDAWAAAPEDKFEFVPWLDSATPSVKARRRVTA